ncbi:MAG: glycosyltransferase, partial [Bdellovibrionales bacterium]|nr:glycosyltransferase [Bdellovibrionales bacterium]
FPVATPETIDPLLPLAEPLKEQIAFLPAVAQDIQAKGFDFVHGILGNGPANAAMLISILTGIPFSFESHAFDLFVHFPDAAAKLAQCAFVQTESDYNRRYLIEECGAEPDKVEVIRLAPDIPMLSSIPENPRIPGMVVSACRLHAIKGLQYGLEAFSRVHQKMPETSYVIIGDGPERPKLERFAEILGIQSAVKFAGDLPNETAAAIMSQASVFLLPCVLAKNGDRDGTPTALAEAQFLKTPVVSSKFSAIPELVEDGVTGILTEPGNVSEIADALSALLADAPLRVSMGEAGRKKIVNEFNIQASTAHLVSLWERHAAEAKACV